MAEAGEGRVHVMRTCIIASLPLWASIFVVIQQKRLFFKKMIFVAFRLCPYMYPGKVIGIVLQDTIMLSRGASCN